MWRTAVRTLHIQQKYKSSTAVQLHSPELQEKLSERSRLSSQCLTDRWDYAALRQHSKKSWIHPRLICHPVNIGASPLLFQRPEVKASYLYFMTETDEGLLTEMVTLSISRGADDDTERGRVRKSSKKYQKIRLKVSKPFVKLGQNWTLKRT